METESSKPKKPGKGSPRLTLSRSIYQMSTLGRIPTHNILMSHILLGSKYKFGAYHDFFRRMNPLDGCGKFGMMVEPW